jgi:protein involved in polysaccharide export with SLBB domain
MLQIDEVVAAGLTTEALKKKIKTELGRFFNDPVPEVFVQGQADQQPDRVHRRRGQKARAVSIARADDHRSVDRSCRRARRVRRQEKDSCHQWNPTERKGESVTWIVNYEDILKGRNLSKNNIVLNPGDTVMVPGGQP